VTNPSQVAVPGFPLACDGPTYDANVFRTFGTAAQKWAFIIEHRWP